MARPFLESAVSQASPQEVTRVLQAMAAGDREAVDQLMPLVYNELRAIAGRYLRQDRPGHTLQATALAHEAYLRLADQNDVQWQNRAHFLAVAAQAIRRILTDYARMHGRMKRGGGRQRVPLSRVMPPAPESDLDWLAIDEALERLSQEAPMESRIVEMRFFGGMSIEEVAEVLEISDRTVRRRWNFARAWLYRELSRGDEASMADGGGE
jgi:RNA polymerase sigma factor (TIGR02999 family)